MNKKIIKYALIVVVLGIWAKIFYDIAQSIDNTPNTPTFAYNSTIDNSYLNDKPQVDYELTSNFRDPFLGKSYRPKPKPKQRLVPKTTVKKVDEKEKIQWPGISYYGVMINKSTGEEQALLTLGLQEYVLGEGDSIANFLIKNIYTDSMLIEQEGVTKTFQKYDYSQK